MASKAKTTAKKRKRSSKASKSAFGKDAVRLIDSYVQRKNAKLKPVADGLRQLVKKTLPGSREAINPWGVPAFDLHGPVCVMMVGKHHITLGFTRGTSLPDGTGLLEGTGKNLRHVKLKEVEQLRDANLRQLLLEAAALNEKSPLTESMRPRKA
jgi:hypothetical protein